MKKENSDQEVTNWKKKKRKKEKDNPLPLNT